MKKFGMDLRVGDKVRWGVITKAEQFLDEGDLVVEITVNGEVYGISPLSEVPVLMLSTGLKCCVSSIGPKCGHL